MGKWNGSAGQGAARTMRAVRRAEAETRQAAAVAERAEREAAYVEPEPLTGEQLQALLFAAIRAGATREYQRRFGGEAL